MRLKLICNRNGVILILALWVMGFLTVLALAIGLGARQKIVVLERLESRARSRAALQAGAKKAIAVLADDMENNQFTLTAAAKARRHNNPDEFARISLGEDLVQVFYEMEIDATGQRVRFFGLVDEQSKINLNTLDKDVLVRLFSRVLGLMTDDSLQLADDILDWRDFARHTTEGFFSDSYYQNLESPYKMKAGRFERVDELLLVKGMTMELYLRLLPYVTVYGDGKININTAGRSVLVALGLDETVVDKILQARRGQDKTEATADDHVFFQTFDVAVEVKNLVPLEDSEARQIDALNARGLIGTSSFEYSFSCRPLQLRGSEDDSGVFGIYNVLTSRIEAWYQK